MILPDEELSGRAVAIDDAGRLLVNTGVGQRAVTAGDVIARPALLSWEALWGPG